MLRGYTGIAYANPRLTQSKLSGIDRDKTAVPIASLSDRPLKNQGAPSASGADVRMRRPAVHRPRPLSGSFLSNSNRLRRGLTTPG